MNLRRGTASLAVSGALAVGAVGLLPAAPAAAATQAIDLYAVTGSSVLPDGTSVPVWGYTLDGSAVDAAGGEPVVVDEGDDVTITLHNGVGAPTSLLLQGQRVVTGQDASGNDTYTFTASKPGTFIYEAAPFGNKEYQTAMGLHGALVVRPAAGAGQAYDGAGTAFDADAVLVLSEIDPALNNAADRTAFDMRGYHPRYFLINGKAYPDTDPIAATGGSRVLLRYVNAGVDYHSMAVLGARQTVVGMDGNELDFPRSYVAQTFGPGESADALVTAPAAAAGHDTSLTVYDAAATRTGNLDYQQASPTTPVAQGMMTTVDVPQTAASGDTEGPVTSKVAVTTAGELTAHVDDSGRGGSDIASVEYFVDDLSAAAGTLTSGSSGATGDYSTAFSVPNGQSVVYVRATDAAGNVGALSSVLLTGADVSAPTTSAVQVTPNRANHGPVVGGADQGVEITVSATGDDTATGNSDVTGGEFFVDAPGADGSGTPMPADSPAPVASLAGAVSAATEASLPEGTHDIWVHSKTGTGADELWEAVPAAPQAQLVVDLTGPQTSGLVLDPAGPSNGTLGSSSGTSTVRLTAGQVTDPTSNGVNSAIKAARACIAGLVDGQCAGPTVQMLALDGSFSSSTEGAYVDIPLSTIRQLSNGTHDFLVQGRDAAGNWGAWSDPLTLTVDKVAPTVTDFTVTASGPVFNLSVTATDPPTTATVPGSGVTAAEYFIDTDPGRGNGTPMTLDAGAWTASFPRSALSGGGSTPHTVYVRVVDAAGNWSQTQSRTVRRNGTVTAGLLFSLSGNVNPPGVTGAADSANLFASDGRTTTLVARATGTSTGGLTALGLPASANVDGLDYVSATRFYLSFSGRTRIPGLGVVQDQDVVRYDNGRWSMFFDGSRHGLQRAGQGLDAIDVSGGKLYFSTRGDVAPRGVRGRADNADIYRWNGRSSYTRVLDATRLGLPAATNVDGFVRADATHFYLAFSTARTQVKGLGTVQDEDVLFNDGGRWSVFFEGTTHGLTTNGLDVDAFDVQ